MADTALAEEQTGKTEINREYRAILQDILSTPHSARQEVQAYHSRIKERLDSGEVIPVPGYEHRLLHENMWVVGDEIYNALDYIAASDKDFCELIEGEDHKGHAKPKLQGARFIVWYAQNFLHGELDDWALAVKTDAERVAQEFFGKPLAEVVIEI